MPLSSISPAAAVAGRIYVGTGGYAYAEWRETGFYPPDMPAEKMLSFYARRFPITELNSTWYQMPQPEMMEALIEQTPAGFLFAVKGHNSLIQPPDGKTISSLTAAFRYGLAPLIQARRLAAVLLPFPGIFDRTLSHRRQLTSLLGHLSELPLAVELRHPSWAVDKVFSEMEKRRVTLVIPDPPDNGQTRIFPTHAAGHRDFFYVRFHGREGDRRPKNGTLAAVQEYGRQELEEWTEKRLAEMIRYARRGFVFFTNHLHGQAVRNAADMAYLASRYGLDVEKT